MRVAVLILWGLTAAPVVGAAVLQEHFSANPAGNGWNNFGRADLFQWDSTNQNLRVTWDSSQTNSYFYRALPVMLDHFDDFELAFDLRLDDIAAGVDPNKASTFQIAVGLLNLAAASRTNFFRGSGI